jgi:hypothetical protein
MATIGMKQDRTRKSGYRGSLNIQDHPSIRRPEPERSIWCLVQWWRCRPPMAELPPAARMAVEALGVIVTQLERTLK